MGAKVTELVLLGLLSAFLCGAAFVYGHVIATAIFAALCVIALGAVGLLAFS